MRPSATVNETVAVGEALAVGSALCQPGHFGELWIKEAFAGRFEVYLLRMGNSPILLEELHYPSRLQSLGSLLLTYYTCGSLIKHLHELLFCTGIEI